MSLVRFASPSCSLKLVSHQDYRKHSTSSLVAARPVGKTDLGHFKGRLRREKLRRGARLLILSVARGHSRGCGKEALADQGFWLQAGKFDTDIRGR